MSDRAESGAGEAAARRVLAFDGTLRGLVPQVDGHGRKTLLVRVETRYSVELLADAGRLFGGLVRVTLEDPLQLPLFPPDGADPEAADGGEPEEEEEADADA